MSAEENKQNEKKSEMTWTIRRSELEAEKMASLRVIYIAGTLFAVVVAFVTKSILLPVLCMVVLVASTYEFFSGRKFVLSEASAKSGNSEMMWSAVKSVHIGEDEVYLSPFAQESKLDAFRGVKLNIQNVSKENVLEFIREHVGKDVQFLGE